MYKILQVRIDLLNYNELKNKLVDNISNKHFTQIATINPEFLVYAYRHLDYQNILNNCDINIVDGRGVQLAFSNKYKFKINRIPGVDIVLLLIKIASEKNLKILFLGGNQGIAAKAANKIKLKYPNLQIKGIGGGQISKQSGIWQQDLSILKLINDFQPNILVVGLGHPKQEEWIADHKNQLKSVQIAIGAGGTLDFLSENVFRAPRFLRNIGLEWLFRMLTQPWRFNRIYQALIIFPFLYFMNSKKNKQLVRTRFAPSPTGFLHIGGLRTALYNYLFARQYQGKFILRIEDTDQERLVPQAQDQLINTLKNFNIEFDEGPTVGGECGPYIQSERLGIYQAHVNNLIEKKLAYHCFCTSDRLQKLREEQEISHIPSKYDRHCLNLSSAGITAKLNTHKPHVARLLIPDGKTSFIDLIRGEIIVDNSVLDDQIILKSDGYPTYHLANVVDDYLMKITHVIRGEEWIPSTPKHIILYKAFGWQLPKFAHLPLLLNYDKSKLSKRQGDVAAEDYLQKGYLPSTLLNFIALLGWNPGTDQEMFTMSELIKGFKLEKVQKSGAVLNIQKLNWLNGQYIKKLPTNDLIQLSEKYLQSISGFKKELYNLNDVMKLCQDRLETLTQIGEHISFLYTLPDYSADLLIPKKSTKDVASKTLQIVFKELLDYKNNWLADSLRELLDTTREKHNLTRNEMFWPLRVAISGQNYSPDVFAIMQVLQKKESLKRIQLALEKK